MAVHPRGVDELERHGENNRRVSNYNYIKLKPFNNLDDFMIGYDTIGRREIRSEGPALPYKERGQAGENRDKGTSGQWNGLGKAGTFGDRERGTAVTSRTMFDTPRQFPIREIQR